MNESLHEQEMEPKHPASFFSGLLLGSLGGAVAMYLLAPRSGKESRQQIQEKAIELFDQTTETAENTVAKVRAGTDRLKTYVGSKSKELKKQGQDMLADQLGRLSAAAESGQKAIQGRHD